MGSGLNTLSHALALRLRDIARMLDRVDRLESGTGNWLAQLSGEDLEGAALQMALRALRTAADPANFALLARLAKQTSAPVPELQQSSGMDRLSLSERLNDMVQVGLVAREIDTDHVQLSEAGAALVGLINDIQQETARRLAEALAPATTLD